jgi:hypothetical protein
MPSGKSKKPSQQQKYAKDLLDAKMKHKHVPDYHKYGLQQDLALRIQDYVDDLFDALSRGMGSVAPHMSTVGDAASMLSQEYSHEDKVLAALREALDYKNSALLKEAVSIPPSMQRLIAHKIEPETASYVIAGSALGISAETVYHIIQGLWSRFKDLYDGQNVDLKAVRAYAKHVREHTDRKTRIMIKDLATAIKHEDWIKAAQIEKQIYKYGQQVGYHKVHEDAGAVGGAPTNNVGGGHIAGAAGDPPGKSKLIKKIVRRRKLF